MIRMFGAWLFYYKVASFALVTLESHLIVWLATFACIIRLWERGGGASFIGDIGPIFNDSTKGTASIWLDGPIWYGG